MAERERGFRFFSGFFSGCFWFSVCRISGQDVELTARSFQIRGAANRMRNFRDWTWIEHVITCSLDQQQMRDEHIVSRHFVPILRVVVLGFLIFRGFSDTLFARGHISSGWPHPRRQWGKQLLATPTSLIQRIWQRIMDTWHFNGFC